MAATNKNISIIILFLALNIAGLSWAEDITTKPNPKADFRQLRQRMVETQIIARGIKDKRLLDVMLKVQRHKFVPAHLQSLAYDDYPLPIGEEQTISQPYVVALMTELLALGGDEKVLEIGTGSGYQAAILAELARQVYTIEILPALAENARKLLNELGYKNIEVRCSDGYQGWEEAAPFDAIIVTCAPKEIPGGLIDQLADGGRMVMPVGDDWQELKLVEKRGSAAETKDIIPVRFVPMIKKNRE